MVDDFPKRHGTCIAKVLFVSTWQIWLNILFAFISLNNVCVFVVMMLIKICLF